MGKSSGDALTLLTISGGVLRLTLLPKKKVDFWLHESIKEPAPLHVLRVGSGAHNDIVVPDKRVTDTHCLLYVTRECIEVSDFGHPGETLVNEAPITTGSVILDKGSVLTLGSEDGVMLWARGCDPGEQPDMVVANLYELIQEAPNYHGTRSKAAKALQVKPATFYRWLKDHKFKLAPLIALLSVVGGAMALRADDRTATPTRATSPAAIGVPAKAPADSVDETEAAEQVKPQPRAVDPTSTTPPAEADYQRSDKKRRRDRRSKPTRPRPEPPMSSPTSEDEPEDAGQEVAEPEPAAEAQRPRKVNGGMYTMEREFRGAAYKIEDGQLVPIAPARPKEKR